MKAEIIIPVRYGSTRFPGKPLAMLGDKSLLHRVVEVARAAALSHPGTTIAVTTEDERIGAHCTEIGVPCLRTPESCATGSDRVYAALQALPDTPDFVINLQGDAPFTPPAAIEALLVAYKNEQNIKVITPVYQLSWEALDRLRENKKSTPFSGTTVSLDRAGCALWFSKNIIPAIRGEEKLRRLNPLSPVYQHLGVYGYATPALEKFCALPPSHYEELEGLEQLRFLENNIPIQCVFIDTPKDAFLGGIDTPEDLNRASAYS